jgi:hypothetical protein
MTRPSKRVETDQNGRPAPAHSPARVYYAGTRRLPNLPDGREVWQALVRGMWRTYYEMPLDGTDFWRMRRLVAVGVRAR